MPADMDERARQSASTGRGDHRPRTGQRRRGRPRFHLPERRSGFDRREQYPLTGALRDNPALLLGVLILINVLSALDFALTFMQLQAGVAEEGNPVLAGLFDAGAGQAWLFKTAVMLVVSLVIWHQRRHRAMLSVALLALGVYVAVIAYHVIGMSMTGLI